MASCASVHVSWCVELFGERAAGSEEERLERTRRHAEDLGDLGVRAALELAEDDRLTLLRRDLRERGEQLADARAVVVRLLAGDALVELDRDVVAPAPAGIAA